MKLKLQEKVYFLVEFKSIIDELHGKIGGDVK